MSSTSSGSSISSSDSSSSSSGGSGGNYSPISNTASGYAAGGVIQTGDNKMTGTPEYYLAGNVGSSEEGQTVWDADLSDGFDSGNTDFELTVDLSGSDGAMLFVDPGGSSGTVSGSLGPSGYVSRVQVSAQASSGGIFRYASISVRFSRAGELTQTVDVGADGLPDADGTSGDGSFQGVEITPSSSDNDSVHVLGVFQMRCPTPNTLPNLVGQILVFS